MEELPTIGSLVARAFYHSRWTPNTSSAEVAVEGVRMNNVMKFAAILIIARIGYWGISQGGWLALAAGAIDPKAAFVISVSAPMTTADVQMNFAYLIRLSSGCLAVDPAKKVNR
jgi:hypothetical protein